jgi:hypothetical protein
MSTEPGGFDLGRDVPTTADDVAALRRLRSEVPGWFSLTPAELLALLPADALDRRPPISDNARPFVLVAEETVAG